MNSQSSRRPCRSSLGSVEFWRGPLGKPRRRVFCPGSYSKTSAVLGLSSRTWSGACMNSPEQRSCPGRAALAKRLVRLPTDGPRFFEVVSYGRAGPKMPGRFSRAQIDQISRTVRHTPEVMVKVTGGGTKRGAVAAHFAYVSRQGALEIETDEGERIGRREEHKRLLDDWHLELTAGQYRRGKDRPARRPTKAARQHRRSLPGRTATAKGPA